MTQRCLRDYKHNVEFQQTPDRTSRQLPNGEYTYFDLNIRCIFCCHSKVLQRASAKECGQAIRQYRFAHSTCHVKIQMRNGRATIVSADRSS